MRNRNETNEKKFELRVAHTAIAVTFSAIVSHSDYNLIIVTEPRPIILLSKICKNCIIFAANSAVIYVTEPQHSNRHAVMAAEISAILSANIFLCSLQRTVEFHATLVNRMHLRECSQLGLVCTVIYVHSSSTALCAAILVDKYAVR